MHEPENHCNRGSILAIGPLGRTMSYVGFKKLPNPPSEDGTNQNVGIRDNHLSEL